MTERKLYDLCLADEDVRISPFCWLAKFALKHKGLDFETAPVGFTDKHNYADPDYGKVPVLIDGGEMIRDSGVIVDYLEKTYPEKPLWRTPGEKAAAAFYQSWLGSTLFPAVGPMAFLRVWRAARDADKDYFRTTREARFGKSLEDVAAGADPAAAVKALAMLDGPLGAFPFLGGDAPNISDYIVFSPLMWLRSVTGETLFEAPPAAAAWERRMLDLFDGYAARAKRAA